MPSPPYFVLFGDSLTQYGGLRDGWATGLAEPYLRRVDVVNRGLAGYNTRWALEVFDLLFGGLDPTSPPELVTIFFGANDAALPDRTSAAQHVPVGEFEANLREIVARFKGLGAKRLVILSPPPLDEDARIVYAKESRGIVIESSERTNDAVSGYAAAAGRVAAVEGVAFVELFERLQQSPDWRRDLFTDGLHFTQLGNDLVLEALREAISAVFPDLAPTDDVLPYWLPATLEITTGPGGPLEVLRRVVTGKHGVPNGPPAGDA